MAQFAKFRGLPRQNCPNSAAHCSLPFVSKISYILFKNFSFEGPAGIVTLCRVMLTTYKENYLSAFLKVQSAGLQCVYLQLCDNY